MEGDRATFDHRTGKSQARGTEVGWGGGGPTVTLEPALTDQAPVADDAHAGQTKLLFAKLHQLAQVLASLMNERLSAREVDLLHTWEGRQPHGPFWCSAAHTSVTILMAQVVFSQCDRREIKLLTLLASSDAGDPSVSLI